MQTYNPKGKNAVPDLTRASVALQTKQLGDLVERAERAGAVDDDDTHHPFALGAFLSTLPDASGLCALGDLSTAEQRLPAADEIPDDPATPDDEHVDAQPATTVSVAWRDVRFTVTPTVPGTVFTGTLHYVQDGCEATYEAKGLYPAVDCGVDDENNPGQRVPDDTLCAAEADPAAGRATGSGINPDLSVVCDPALLLCVQKDG